MVWVTRLWGPRAYWILWITILGLLYGALPNHSDQFDADYIACRMLSGSRLYVDVVDMNWPGEPLIHMLTCWAPYGIFYAWRLLDYLVMILGVLSLASIFDGEWGPISGHVVRVFLPLFYVGLGSVMPGQRDMLIANLLFIILWVHLRAWRQQRGQLHVVVGLLIGMAALIKPTAAPVGILLVLHGCLTSSQPHRFRATAMSALVAGSSAVSVVAVGFLAIRATGTPWSAIWNCCFVYNSATQYLHDASNGELAKNFIKFLAGTTKLLIPFVLIGAWKLVACKRASSAARYALPLMFAAGLANFWLQRRAFTWHMAIVWAATMAVACLGIAEVISWARHPRRRWLGIAGLALLAVLSIRKVQLQWPMMQVVIGQKTPLELTANRVDITGTADVLRLARRYAPDARNVLYITFVPSAAMQLGHWVSPTRFYYPFMLTNANSVIPFGERWLQEFEKDVFTRQPSMFILDTGTYAELKRMNPAATDVLERLLSNYEEMGRVEYLNTYISHSPTEAIVYLPKADARQALSAHPL